MSLIFAQLQMAELERYEQRAGRNRLMFEPEALAVDTDEFSALEDRVIRAVELVKRERQDRASAEERAVHAEAELSIQLPRIEVLERELDAFKNASELGHRRIEQLLSQLDAVLA